MKNKKDKFSLNNLDNEQDFLTHKGKKINESGNYSDDDFVQSDDEMYDKLDNYMNEIENAPDTKLSRKQIIQNIIDKSKQLKLEKQNQRRKNIEQIKLLDDNFAELSELIKRRPRSIGRLNDDFERMANSYNYLDKTKPTERIKSEKEIELEKENEIKKKLRQQIREDTDQEDEENSNDESIQNSNGEKDLNDHPDINADDDIKRPLTKKERIIKLMEKRLNKTAAKVDKDEIALLKKKRVRGKNEEDSNDEEDNLSDLDEFEQKNQKSKRKNLDDIEEEEKDYDGDSHEEYEDENYEEGEFEDEESNENDDFDEIAVKRNKIITERGDYNDNEDFEDDEEYSDDIEIMKKNGEL